MNIKVRLFATLRMGRFKENIMDFDKGTTPQQIIQHLEIDLSDVAILLVNGRDGKLDQELEESDTVSIFPPVGGG